MADVTPGALLTLTVDKPAAGGRMIARHEGRVVLVAGAIPDEQVIARVEKVGKGVVYAVVREVAHPSPDRRNPGSDPSCGGCLYAHIAYSRQVELKAQVIADAFSRIARLPLPARIDVIASPRQEAYRMRARFHLRAGRAGFFREGSHDLCDPRQTRQLLPESCDAIDRLAAALGSAADLVRDLELTENVEGTERVVHIGATAPLPPRPLLQFADLTGITAGGWSATRAADVVIAGHPYVFDTLSTGSGAVQLRRHVLSFFQGNRYLLQTLMDEVTSLIPQGARTIDLYAGAGLFAIGAAVARGARVIAVEGDHASAADLDANAAALGGAVEAVHQSVEAFTSRARGRPDVLIVDPPRTGMSREALGGALRLAGPTIVYVSCDVATLARDARRLADAGYLLRQVKGIDLFPNTPHVEVIAVFDRV